jgi:hypothetical protein
MTAIMATPPAQGGKIEGRGNTAKARRRRLTKLDNGVAIRAQSAHIPAA